MISTISYRKGIVKFVRKKFPKKSREIENLERTASVRKTSDLKVNNTIINLMFRHNFLLIFQEDNAITTYAIPLKGQL